MIYYNGRPVELMAPAGSEAALSAALRAGADAVYFGVGDLNMRAGAGRPFSASELPALARRCRAVGVKSRLALNTVIYDRERAEVEQLCRQAAEAGVDAVIASDMAVVLAARAVGLPVHMSVQANIANMQAVRFFSAYADVVVPARELTLAQIQYMGEAIKKESVCGPSGEPVRLELFIHGALCVARSGTCGMSLATYNASANRGVCRQNCRRRYRVTDVETGDELELDNEFVMSPRDLCMIRHLPELLASGVTVLKIEGRGRPADYVHTVTEVYREALEAVAAHRCTGEQIAAWERRLKQVFNRGFWYGGYYCGRPLGDWSGRGHSQAERRRVQVGTVSNWFDRVGVAEFTMRHEELHSGDELLFEGATTGALLMEVGEFRVDGRPATCAGRGDVVTVAPPRKVRRNDKVFIRKEREPKA